MKTSTAIIVLLLSSFFVASTNCSQDVPLQKQEYGFTIGNPNGTLHIEFFIDFVCPDSKESYNQWVQVMKNIDLAKQGVKFTYQFNPLTWHFYAFKINQAFLYVMENKGSLQAQRFIEYFFANQDSYAEEKWMDKTISQFLDELAKTVAQLNDVNEEALRSQLEFGTVSFDTTRFHWKYSVSQGVSGAPIFYMNGYRIDGAEGYKAGDWINFIQKYRNVGHLQRHEPLLKLD